MHYRSCEVFPAEASGSVAMLKALLALYAMLKIMPTGVAFIWVILRII
nr:hypothetical protein [Suttonella ornithocola]